MRGALLVLVVLLAGCVEAPDLPGAASANAVVFETITFETAQGSFVVALYPDAAPETVALMKTLVGEGYYEGRTFTRVVPGHVIQQVDRTSEATDDARRVPLETNESYHFTAGAAGIARSEDPNSGGPEFFIMDFATSHLDGNFTVWGQVIEGLQAVHKIARVPSVDFTAGGKAPFILGDRHAVDPVEITQAKLGSIELHGDVASKLPGRVAQNVRVGDMRHSLEWPADLAPGRPSALTWYVRPYNDAKAPASAGASVRFDDGSPASTVLGEDPAFPGIYHFLWTPLKAGATNATLVVDGKELATLTIEARRGP